MSKGDGRHRIGSAGEQELHDEIKRSTRDMIDGYCVRRRRQQRRGQGGESKKSVFQKELAGQLGISLRQLEGHCRDVPLTLARAVLLSRCCGDERLLDFFGAAIGAVRIAPPKSGTVLDTALGAAADPAGAGAEPVANVKQLAEARQATPALADGEQAGWAGRRNEAAAEPAPEFVDPTQPRPGHWPEIGFSADAPE